MATEPVVKEFNKALFSIRDSKVAISKQKILEITRKAMDGIRFFKHIVLAVEKFVQKCDPKFKMPAFYVIDSIVRQGFKQHKEKDVFGPRFAINLVKTLENAMNCSDEDRLKIVRVINLWKVHSVFQLNVIESLLQYCQSIGLDVDVKTVEMKVKGAQANLTIYSKDGASKKSKKMSPKTPPLNDDLNRSSAPEASKELFLSDVAPPNSISEKEIHTRLQLTFPHWVTLIEKDRVAFQKFVNLVNDLLKKRVDQEKANQGANISSILANDFEYSDDEEEQKQKSEFHLSKEKIDSFVNEVFLDESLRANTAAIHNALIPTPTSLPNVANIFANKPPPLSSTWFNPMQNTQLNQFPNPFELNQNNLPPMPVQPPPSNSQDNGKADSLSRNSKHGRRKDRDERDRSQDSRSPDRKRRHHSRSPSSSEKEKERERRRMGLPLRLRNEETIIASRTLWFGRLPSNCNDQDIRNAVKDTGTTPEKINMIPSRACAYVILPQRRAAYKIFDRLHRDIRVSGKSIKIEWTVGAGIQKSDKIMDYWDAERGYLSIPHKKLPKDLAPLLEGNHLEVDSLPANLKGKYTETGVIENAEPQIEEQVQLAQPPIDIPLPSLDQLQAMPTFPLPTDTNTGALQGLPLAFPGFIQPNLLAVLAQQQQPPPNFDNLFAALQQNSGGLLPTPQIGQQPPNIFNNLNFDNGLDKQLGIDPQQFQPKFSRGRGNHEGGFRGRGARGGNFNQNFRPRGGNHEGVFRGRGGHRGNFNQNFRPRGDFGFRGRNNSRFSNQFVPNENTETNQQAENNTSTEMDIENDLLT